MRQQTLRLLRAAGAVREALTAQTAQKSLSALVEASSCWKNAASLRTLSSLSRSSQQAAPCSFALASALQQCGISTSVGAHIALAEVAVDGDLEGVARELESILSNESVTAKEVADAAVSLAYLQVKGDRRIWGKVFERASAVKGSFDAASLTSFLWAATTAGVDHFKTIAELSGPASSLLSTMSPTQVSIVAEALGRGCVKDAELFNKISAEVSSNVAKYKAADLARLLWGFAAAHHEDAALAKAVSKALTEKASELSHKEAVQAIWALAKLRRTDKPCLDALLKAAKGKPLESVVDAAALAWALGFLHHKADAETARGLSAALKAGAAELSPAHAIDAAWGLSLCGSAADKDAVSALFVVAAAAVEKDPASVDAYALGALYNAAVLVPGAKLPDQVSSYALKMYNLGGESMALKRGSAVSAFKEDLAEAVARAFGARYRPEVTAAVRGYATTTPEGISIDIAVAHGGAKYAVEPVNPGYVSATNPGALLGPAVARAGLLEASGYKVVSVPHSEWAGLQDAKAKAAFVLNAVKAAGGKVDALQKKLNEPFNPYAE